MITAMTVGREARAFIAYQEEVHGIDPASWSDPALFDPRDTDVLALWAEDACDQELNLLALAVVEESWAVAT